MSIDAYLDPSQCPASRPPLEAMSEQTRALHGQIDDRIREAGRGWLHPDSPTLMEDLLGSPRVVAWQEEKAARHMLGEACWSELTPLYARYGTMDTIALIQKVKAMEAALAAVVTDCGMQATAVVFDALLAPGAHAILCRQVYNKSRTYLERLLLRIGGKLTVVDDGDFGAIRAAIRPETRLLFAETFTNPRMRVQDPVALAALTAEARQTASGIRLVVDDTIATPWGTHQPLLTLGVDVVVASGTKALGGQDRDLWGYAASNDVRLMNGVMDLLALRGGTLDWRRARAILAGLGDASARHEQRCRNAARVADFLAKHPRVSEVMHPSLPDHPDADVVAAHYARRGSLLSFRIDGADEAQTQHFADVLATCVVIRYALSFDGLVTKVNHHRTVSEYFTPRPVLRRNGFDRLVRLGIGLESAADLCACLNWTLWHGAQISPEELDGWRESRIRALRLRD
ncbi:MAG: PLP-dependent transferase [Myxococcota bacterium]